MGGPSRVICKGVLAFRYLVSRYLWRGALRDRYYSDWMNSVEIRRWGKGDACMRSLYLLMLRGCVEGEMKCVRISACLLTSKPPVGYLDTLYRQSWAPTTKTRPHTYIMASTCCGYGSFASDRYLLYFDISVTRYLLMLLSFFSFLFFFGDAQAPCCHCCLTFTCQFGKCARVGPKLS